MLLLFSKQIFEFLKKKKHYFDLFVLLFLQINFNLMTIMTKFTV